MSIQSLQQKHGVGDFLAASNRCEKFDLMTSNKKRPTKVVLGGCSCSNETTPGRNRATGWGTVELELLEGAGQWAENTPLSQPVFGQIERFLGP